MTEKNKKNNHYIFPKWSNKVISVIGVALLLKVIFIIYLFEFWFSPKHLEIGYQPEQPIPYSHSLHAGELGIDCRYCHYNVEDAAHANIPSAELCMNCHSNIKQDSPHIKKLKQHYESGEPIEWINVHMLPDYAYFNHSRHVNSGVSCVQCHGRVDQMEVVRQVESLSMGWCLECHRNPENYVWPKDKVTKLGWEPAEDQVEMGKRLVEEYHLNPNDECSTCHKIKQGEVMDKQWRSLEDLSGSKAIDSFKYREFSEGASVLEDGVSRRSFIKLLGSTAALAGISGCNIRKPYYKIKPYSKKVEHVVPGNPIYFTSALQCGLDVSGILIETHEGRPTKVEGNPTFPGSTGSSTALQQAEILNLYDPDRLSEPLNSTKSVGLDSFKDWVSDKRREFKQDKGKGLAIVVEESLSPTFHKELSSLKKSFLKLKYSNII